jgi:hypothetical protein
MSESSEVKLRFQLQNVDPSADDETVRRLFDEAVEAATQAAGTDSEITAKAEFEGKFLGVGEIAVVLWIVHALKVGGVAFYGGAAGAAGKYFFDHYLAPELTKRNLLPAKVEEVKATESPDKPAGK